MVMATKYQILMSRNPRHLVMITLNHIDAMLDFTTNAAVKQNINAAYELLIQVKTNNKSQRRLKSFSFHKNELIYQSFFIFISLFRPTAAYL